MFFYLEDCKTAVSLSAFIKRAQIEHKRSLGIWNWNFYSEESTIKYYGWVTNHHRFIAVGPPVAPVVKLKPGEILIPVALPWKGSGQQLAALSAYHSRRKAIRKPTFALTAKGKLRTAIPVLD